MHQSGQLGQVQGDAIRSVQGNISRASNNQAMFGGSSGALAGAGGYTSFPSHNGGGGGGSGYNGIDFDTSRVDPTASEIRPVNMAVRYLVKAMR